MAGGGVEVDAAAQAFTGKVFGMIAGGVSAFMIDLGLRTGLFDAAAGAGPLTSGELAVQRFRSRVSPASISPGTRSPTAKLKLLGSAWPTRGLKSETSPSY